MTLSQNPKSSIFTKSAFANPYAPTSIGSSFRIFVTPLVLHLAFVFYHSPHVGFGSATEAGPNPEIFIPSMYKSVDFANWEKKEKRRSWSLRVPR